MNAIALSPLPHTWLIDVDGTMLQHNAHLSGPDVLLPGVAAFWQTIPAADKIILLSARTEAEKPATLAFIQQCGLRFDQAIFGLPTGERVLINDSKPSGLVTALAVAVPRDAGLGGLAITIDPQR